MSSTATMTSTSTCAADTRNRTRTPRPPVEAPLPPLVPPPWYASLPPIPFNRKKRRNSADEFDCNRRSLKEIRDQIPLHLFERNTPKALAYAARDLALAAALFALARRIDWLCAHPALQPFMNPMSSAVLRGACWLA
ncbi:hypothetical protein TRAPUB_9394 [Trametes pubescens]|uniref:Uncharacterized protein n=1 Tax=Trametes pubescens TaxID=154538 RepID=A0A1M2W2F3_TRAPU|nr:hypothetical protein TRAPUB_9394 [Trametes pubescens]